MKAETRKYSQELQDLLKDPLARLAWEEEGLLGAFALGIERVMNKKGLTQAKLARSINKSPQAVSRALGGGQNLSVRTMLEIALATEQTVKINLEPLEDLAAAQTTVRVTHPMQMIDYKMRAEVLFKFQGLPTQPSRQEMETLT